MSAFTGKCVHGADGATIINGKLSAPLCEACARQAQLEEAWAAPSYDLPRISVESYLDTLGLGEGRDTT